MRKGGGKYHAKSLRSKEHLLKNMRKRSNFTFKSSLLCRANKEKVLRHKNKTWNGGRVSISQFLWEKKAIGEVIKILSCIRRLFQKNLVTDLLINFQLILLLFLNVYVFCYQCYCKPTYNALIYFTKNIKYTITFLV